MSKLKLCENCKEYIKKDDEYEKVGKEYYCADCYYELFTKGEDVEPDV